ncbi:MAG: PAS domain S-box protein [Candidatus Latescibacteria bacterium]|nr:PAS domain S-box protein [Candidatus Latescibacterota bacterium]
MAHGEAPPSRPSKASLRSIHSTPITAHHQVPQWAGYTLAIGLIAATLLADFAVGSATGSRPPVIFFTLPIMLCAYLGGLGPGLLATALAAIGIWYLLLPPTFSWQIEQSTDLARLVTLAAAGTLVSCLSESLHRARRRAEINQRQQAVILTSIGDGVITTNTQGRVTFLNPEAERLTGWTSAEAAGQPLPAVFPLIAEQTREPVEDPVQKVLRLGTVVNLANHTLLLSRDGREFPIADSAAPIRFEDGRVQGVVLVFRDHSAPRQAEKALRQSEERLRAFFDHAQASVWLKDLDGRFLDINQYDLAIHGLPIAQVLGHTVFEIWPQPQAQTYADNDRRVIEAGAPMIFEEKALLADGEHVFLTTKFPLRDAAGRIYALGAICTDITNRKHAEDLLRENEARFRHLIEALPVALFIQTRGCFAYLNRAAIRLFGAAGDELLGTRVADLFPPERRQLVAERIRRLNEERQPVPPLENSIQQPDGTWVPVTVVAAPFTWHGEASALVLVHDLTEAKKAEAAIRDRLRLEEQFSRLAATAPGGIYILQTWPDTRARFLYASPGFATLTGVPLEQLLNDTEAVMAQIHPDDQPGYAAAFREALQRLGMFAAEFRISHPQQGWIWVEARSTPQPQPDGSVWWHGFTSDITARKQAEQALLNQEALLRETGHLAKVGGWVFDTTTGESHWTEEVARIHDLDPQQSISKELGLNYYQGESRARIEAAVAAAIAQGTPYDLELELVSAAGKRKWVRTIGHPVRENGRVVGLRGSLQDITERVQLEAQLRQAQKMEAIGQLAGGVAHDFNNLLTVIMGAGELVLMRTPADDPRRSLLADILHAGERAAALTSQLLAFSRRQMLNPVVLDLNHAVANPEKMLRRLIGEDITLTAVLSPALNRVRIDPGQLEQVILNLAVNARDAMPQGGLLTIETRAIELDEGYCRAHPEVQPGHYVLLSMTDTGQGMSPEVKARIFEPFFTTKVAGKGTGLGLATVFGIVKQSEGHIEVYSETGVGTGFKIYLPAVDAEAAPARPAGQDEVPSGHETILVAEDEQGLRRLAREILEGYGYRVLEAANGREGLELALAQEDQIDLLLTDIVMPEMGGRDLAAALQARCPGLKVLFMSGYIDDAVVRHGIVGAGETFLHKPFSPAALGRKVRQLLDHTPPPA